MSWLNDVSHDERFVWIFTRPLTIGFLPLVASSSRGRHALCHWGVLVADTSRDLKDLRMIINDIQDLELGTMWELQPTPTGHNQVHRNRFNISMVSGEWRDFSVVYAGTTTLTDEQISNEALRIIKDRPDYRFIENNCQNFGRYLIETISPNSLCPETIQTILQGFLKTPNNPEVHARLPGAYPRSLTSNTESGTYYTAFESVTIETESHTDDTAPKPRSESKPIQINLWEDFLIYGEIESLLEVIPLSFSYDPHTMGQGGRASVETNLFELANFINDVSYRSACEIQATENPTFVAIGHGRWARQLKRIPDFAACQYVQGSSNGPNEMENRIPGEAKLFRRVRHSLLSPDGQHGNAAPGAAAQRAVHEIYEYMHYYEARYGYIINEEELIMFRRTHRGQIDISPAIRHDVVVDLDQEIWNSKIVLFYFHWIVANDDALWRFQSFESEYLGRR